MGLIGIIWFDKTNGYISKIVNTVRKISFLKLTFNKFPCPITENILWLEEFFNSPSEMEFGESLMIWGRLFDDQWM